MNCHVCVATQAQLYNLTMAIATWPRQYSLGLRRFRLCADSRTLRPAPAGARLRSHGVRRFRLVFANGLNGLNGLTHSPGRARLLHSHLVRL